MPNSSGSASPQSSMTTSSTSAAGAARIDLVVEKRCEQEWQHLHDKQDFCYGLIIGLPSAAKPDYIVQLIPTPSLDGDRQTDAAAAAAAAKEDAVQPRDQEVSSSSSSSSSNSSSPNGSDAATATTTAAAVRINYDDAIDHALSALRMLPGCCYVLGVFCIEREMPALDSKGATEQLRTMRKLFSALADTDWLNGSEEGYDFRDKVLLHYAGPDAGVRCTSVPLETDAALAPLALRVEQAPIDWVNFQSQLAEPFEFHIKRRDDGTASLEENVWHYVALLSDRLAQSRIFHDAEASVNQPTVTVTNYLRSRRTPDERTVRTTLYVEVEDPQAGAHKYRPTRANGYVRCMGEVSASVFVHPQQRIVDIDRYLRTDVMRSVAGRLRLFLDAFPKLDERERWHVLQRLQPPRRVFFHPFVGSRIQYSDYLFPEEGADVVAANAQLVFGVSIAPHMVNQKMEKLRLPKRKNARTAAGGAAEESLLRQKVERTQALCVRSVGVVAAAFVAVVAIVFGALFWHAEPDVRRHFF